MLCDKKVAIFLDDEYQELEFWYPYLRLQEEDIHPLVIGYEKKTYKSRVGYDAEADINIHNAIKMSFDAIIIPGGYAPDKIRGHSAMLELVRTTYDNGGLIAAICHAIWVPISAKIMSGKKATCVHVIKDDLVNAGGIYLDQAVVVDQRIITSRLPSDLPIFCKTIIQHLKRPQ